MKKIFTFLLLSYLNVGNSYAQIFQNTCNPDMIIVDTVGAEINWSQFPDFDLPHTVIYHGVAPTDSILYPLKKGFSHITVRGKNYIDTIANNQRVYLWTGIANANNWAIDTKQPWRMIKSPWNNDITGYRNAWMNRLNYVAENKFKTVIPDSLAPWDMLILDIEWHLSEAAILSIKTDSLVPLYYQQLDDATFISEYKKAMESLYAEPAKLIRDSFNLNIKISSYKDVPIGRTYWGIDDHSWSNWKSDTTHLDYVMLDSNQNAYGEYYHGLDFLSPSIYNFYNRDSTPAGKKYLAYNLFQIEVNKAWSSKKQLAFTWLNYHDCCSDVEAISADMAEATAIFPLMAGASIYNWKFTNDESESYEYFIKGLYRLSTFNHFFDGTEKYISPINPAHQSWINNEAIWRGVVHNNKILIAAHNPFANPTDTTIIPISYGSWSDSIAVIGLQTFLCEIDMCSLATPDTTLVELVSCDLNQVGTITDSLTNINGCDSIVITNTSFIGQGNPTVIELTTCNQNDVGTITDSLSNINGCDSIVIQITTLDTSCINEIVFLEIPEDINIGCNDSIPSELNVTATNDNCPGNLSIEIQIQKIDSACNFLRTWTASDSCGNINTASQLITVIDTIVPLLGIIPADTTIYAVFGQEIPTPQVEATDNCDPNVEIMLTETETIISNGYSLVRSWIAVDNCGNASEAKTQVVTVIGGPIWPGDTDSSHLVELKDIFNIGLGFGQTGFARNNPSTEWLAQYTSPWAQASPSYQINFRHADTNGDGIIDINDVDVILQNLGLSHNLVRADTFDINNDFTIHLQTRNISQDGWVDLDISLDDPHLIIQDFYGLSFRLFYDWTKVEANTLTINYNQSWAGTLNENLINIEKENYSEGEFNTAFVRTDQQGVNGSGKIATLRFKLKPTAGAQLRMKLEKITKINSNGMITNGKTEIIEIDLTTTSTNEISNLDHHLHLYPNPTSNQVHLKLDQEFHPEYLSIYNSFGQLIQHKIWTKRTTKLDLSSLASGVYFIQVQSKEGLLTKKLTISR